MVPQYGYHFLVSICFALGNKSGSFCEAVNCERSEQEGKFLFAMLMVSIWRYNCMIPSGKVKTRESAESCGIIL